MDNGKDIIKKYQGNYIGEMRKLVGHAPLMSVGCGVIQNDTEEAIEHRFFPGTKLPDDLNQADRQVILAWASKAKELIVD